jgi:hypothetical protein
MIIIVIIMINFIITIIKLDTISITRFGYCFTSTDTEAY